MIKKATIQKSKNLLLHLTLTYLRERERERERERMCKVRGRRWVSHVQAPL
jgi:hypothetical protein